MPILLPSFERCLFNFIPNLDNTAFLETNPQSGLFPPYPQNVTWKMLIFHGHVGVVGGVNWQHASPFQVEFSLMICTENAGNAAALRVPPRRPSVRWMRRWPPLTVAFDGSRQVGGSLYKWSQWNPGEREVYANELWVPVFWFVNYVKNPGGDHVDGNYCTVAVCEYVMCV